MLNERDYNNAKQHLRDTTYRFVSTRGGDGKLVVVDVTVSHEFEARQIPE